MNLNFKGLYLVKKNLVICITFACDMLTLFFLLSSVYLTSCVPFNPRMLFKISFLYKKDKVFYFLKVGL